MYEYLSNFESEKFEDYKQLVQYQCQHCLNTISIYEFPKDITLICDKCGSTNFKIIGQSLTLKIKDKKSHNYNNKEKKKNESNSNLTKRELSLKEKETFTQYKESYALPPHSPYSAHTIKEINIPILQNYEKIFLVLLLILLPFLFLFSQQYLSIKIAKLINISFLTFSGVLGIILNEDLINKLNKKLSPLLGNKIKKNYIAKCFNLSRIDFDSIYEVSSALIYFFIFALVFMLLITGNFPYFIEEYVAIILLILCVGLIALILLMIPYIIFIEGKGIDNLLNRIFTPIFFVLSKIDSIIKFILKIMLKIFVTPIYLILTWREFFSSCFCLLGLFIAKLQKKYTVFSVRLSLLQFLRISLILMCSIGNILILIKT